MEMNNELNGVAAQAEQAARFGDSLISTLALIK